jgi:excisionase family DNA binding protein
MEKLEKNYYSFEQTADLLSFSKATLSNLVEDEKITFFKVTTNIFRFPKNVIKKSVDVKSAAKKLGLSPSSMRNLIKEKKINVTNYGERLTRITEEEIDNYIKRNTITPKTSK